MINPLLCKENLSDEEFLYSLTREEQIEYIYSSPRSRKYKYHKDHSKHIAIGSSIFSNFIQGLATTARKKE